MSSIRRSIGRALFRLAAKVDAGPYVKYSRTVHTPLGWSKSNLDGTGLDNLAPGTGRAAQIGIDLANRSIREPSKSARLPPGWLETMMMLPGDNSKPSIGNSWFAKIAAGMAATSPTLPNDQRPWEGMNLSRPRPSYFRRVWNALRGR